MRHRPKRGNYPRGIYGDYDYYERLERYCTYLENRNRELTDQCGVAKTDRRSTTVETGMTAEEVINILEGHNLWRRGADYVQPTDPRLLGVALDKAIELLRLSDAGGSSVLNIKSFKDFINNLCETDYAKRKKPHKYKGDWYGIVELRDIYRREFLN